MNSKKVTSLKVCFGNLISDVARWIGLSVGICDKGGLVQPLNSTGRVHVCVEGGKTLTTADVSVQLPL